VLNATTDSGIKKKVCVRGVDDDRRPNEMQTSPHAQWWTNPASILSIWGGGSIGDVVAETKNEKWSNETQGQQETDRQFMVRFQQNCVVSLH
jgi:hypothetical protein